jgi:hypothetical protein
MNKQYNESTINLNDNKFLTKKEIGKLLYLKIDKYLKDNNLNYNSCNLLGLLLTLDIWNLFYISIDREENVIEFNKKINDAIIIEKLRIEGCQKAEEKEKYNLYNNVDLYLNYLNKDIRIFNPVKITDSLWNIVLDKYKCYTYLNYKCWIKANIQDLILHEINRPEYNRQEYNRQEYNRQEYNRQEYEIEKVNKRRKVMCDYNDTMSD